MKECCDLYCFAFHYFHTLIDNTPSRILPRLFDFIFAFFVSKPSYFLPQVFQLLLPVSQPDGISKTIGYFSDVSIVVTRWLASSLGHQGISKHTIWETFLNQWRMFQYQAIWWTSIQAIGLLLRTKPFTGHTTPVQLGDRSTKRT